jgi:hypothetical protein
MALALVGAVVPVAASAQASSGDAVYRLTQIGKAGVPVVVDIDDEGMCREELVSAVLSLHENGTWDLTSRSRKICNGDHVEDVDQDFDRGLFTIDGSTVTFYDEDGRPPRNKSLDRDLDIEIDDLGVGTLSRGALSVRLEEGVIAIFRM